MSQGVRSIVHPLIYHDVIQHLPIRKSTQHKGDNGHLCVIGAGIAAYSGAICLAGEAALRAGAGLVSAVVAPESLALMARAPMELMCHGVEKPKQISALIEKANALVLGPGLGDTRWSKSFFEAFIDLKKPMVVDADGLNWLAKYPQKNSNFVLTPHPKEAARLLDQSTEQVQADRLVAARSLAQKYGCVVVLKGAGTIIIDEDEHLYMQEGGYPVLGTAGTGDILAGLIGGLLAQDLGAGLAAQIAVSVHTHAAKVEQSMGDRGMLASELFLHIRALMNPMTGGSSLP